MGELRRPTRDIFLLFVVSFWSNECRGTVVPRAAGPAQHRTPRGWHFAHSLNLCRHFLVDCVVLVQIVGSTRSMSLTRGGFFFVHGGKLFRAREMWSNSRHLLQIVAVVS